MRIILIAVAAMLISPSARASECRTVPRDDARWAALDRRYAIIETGTFNRDPKLLFSVYSPDFEAHQFNGEVWKFSQSAAYSTAGMDQVKENISLSNTILTLTECDPHTLVATVLQQWSRKQMSLGKVRLYQTTTVQDETWVNSQGQWMRKRVENERPGAWLIDLKRIDPSKPFDPDAPEYDPHQTKKVGPGTSTK